MPVIVTDSFSPAVNPLNPTNWTIVTGSSGLQATGTAGIPLATTVSREVNSAALPSDQYVRAKSISVDGAASTIMLLTVRASAITAALNYQVQITPATSVYRILVGGVSLTTGSLNTPYNPNDFFMLGVKGTTITFYQNGIACVNSATDATLTSGSAGLGFLTSTTVANNQWATFDAGSIVTTVAPSFSVPGGSYSSAQNVVLTSSTPSSTIYYTTDGSTPTTASSNVPSGGTVVVATSLTLKALALSNGPLDTQSTVTSATYTITGGGSKNPDLYTNPQMTASMRGVRV